MGLFTKLFSKKNKTNTTSNQEAGNWNFYFTNIDEVIASVYLDLDFAGKGVDTDFPYFFWFALNMNQPREDGMSSQEEFQTLYEFENKLTQVLAHSKNYKFAGRVTTKGRREFYFYCANNEMPEAEIVRVMAAFPEYTGDKGFKHDPNWDIFKNRMYPKPIDFQKISNRNLVMVLQKNGDQLVTERPVFHWIYFKTETDLEAYAQAVKSMEYEIVSKNSDTTQGEFCHQLQVSRIDLVGFNEIDDCVLPLFELAVVHNGNYDGWETSVER